MIRPLTIDDAPRIVEIEGREQIAAQPQKVIYDWFLKGAFGWGLEEDGILYGYTIVRKCSDEQYHSLITCISKEFQNKKHGRRLCQYMFDRVKEMGGDTIVFEVRKSNAMELSMVKHYNAFVTGERPLYYGDEDAYLMQVNIKELPNDTSND